jgi:hypothetical protein
MKVAGASLTRIVTKKAWTQRNVGAREENKTSLGLLKADIGSLFNYLRRSNIYNVVSGGVILIMTTIKIKLRQTSELASEPHSTRK